MYNDNVGDGWLFVTASSWKNSVNASIGGIGILLSPRAQKSLNQVEKISDRIIIASFNGNPKASVVCCYSPMECSDEQDAITFYTELSSLIRMILLALLALTTELFLRLLNLVFDLQKRLSHTR